MISVLVCLRGVEATALPTPNSLFAPFCVPAGHAICLFVGQNPGAFPQEARGDESHPR